MWRQKATKPTIAAWRGEHGFGGGSQVWDEGFRHMALDACRTLEVMGNMEILQYDDEDKEDDTGEEVMYDVCKAIQDMMEQSRQKGIEKGIDQSLCIHVTVLMKNMNWTEEMACKALDVTPEEYRAARSKM